MRRQLIILIIVFGVAAGLYFAGRPHRSQTRGSNAAMEMAPDFSLTGLDGNAIRLSSLKGKVVVLNFWATWCEPCRTEMPAFVQMQRSYDARGLQFVGISMDDSARPVKQFAQQFGINYPIALGNDRVAQAYGGILGLPVTFVIDRQGRIAFKHAGPVSLTVLQQEVQPLLAK